MTRHRKPTWLAAQRSFEKSCWIEAYRYLRDHLPAELGIFICSAVVSGGSIFERLIYGLSGLGLFAFFVLVWFAYTAPYRVWAEQYLAIASAQQALEEFKSSSATPRIVPEINSVGWSVRKNHLAIKAYMQIAVANLGSPSVVDHYQSRLKVGETYLEFSLRLFPNDEMTQKLRLIPEDYLPEKTAQKPIPCGGRVRGWLYFETKESDAELVKEVFSGELKSTQLQVACKDVMGNVAIAALDLTDDTITQELVYHADGRYGSGRLNLDDQ